MFYFKDRSITAVRRGLILSRQSYKFVRCAMSTSGLFPFLRQSLSRRLTVVIVLKILLLMTLWWFIRDYRVVVDPETMTQHALHSSSDSQAVQESNRGLRTSR